MVIFKVSNTTICDEKKNLKGRKNVAEPGVRAGARARAEKNICGSATLLSAQDFQVELQI
jgi:hypothetical protein